MTDHTACCRTETLNDLRALKAAYRSAYRAYEDAGRRDRDEMAGRLTEAIDERDRARDTAARLEAELARGFRTAPPDITISHSDGPAIPNNPDPGDRIVQIRPGSGNTPTDAYPPENGPETARTAPATPDRSDERTL